MGKILPKLMIWIIALTMIASPSLAIEQNLDHKIGQMLMLGFQGAAPASVGAQRLAAQIRRGEVGGVVMLGYNFKRKQAVKGLTSLFRKAAGGSKIFLAVDMEGGAVQRLGRKLGFPSIPSAWKVANRQTPLQAKKTYSKLAQISRNAGFNMNLGPVVDLRVNPANPVIAKYGRSYSANPAKTILYARAFIQAHSALGILTVLKHFPGHGSSRGDSHDGFVDISQSWRQQELQPFAQLINSGDASAIMPGHLIHNKIAHDGVPVSLSKPAISGLLRKQLKFSGLVVSDDLQMGAIAKNYSYKQAIIRAVNAGVDLLMISNSRKPDKNLATKTIAIIKQAIANGQISLHTIEAADNRIQRAKKHIQ